MCACVLRKGRKDKEERDREKREFGDLCVWTYTVYIHVFSGNRNNIHKT